VIWNAVIESVTLGYHERGFLDMWLFLNYGDCSQGFGGFALYLPKEFDHHSIQSPAGHHIFRCMEVAGVDRFDNLKNRNIRVNIQDGLIKGIGHIIEDKWYYPGKELA